METSDLTKVCLEFLGIELSYRPEINRGHTLMIVWYPVTWFIGAKGWTLLRPCMVTGIIELVLFSFIVQLPRGIMACTKLKSFACRW